jgi:outer membrane protein assembly factor BamB
VVFTEGNRTYVAVTSGRRLYLLDAASLGGADQRTPLFATQDAPDVSFSNDGIATWRDAAGVRWILAEVSSAIAAFKLVERGNAPALERVWTSNTMASPRTPIVVNGVVFALAAGKIGVNAVLYALDPATGKELWNSGTTITSPASAGLSSGTGQVHVVTADNTVYAFGIPLAIN